MYGVLPFRIAAFTIEISLSEIEGKKMPEEQVILDKVIDQLYDLSIEDSAIIDTVLITEVNGQPTADRT